MKKMITVYFLSIIIALSQVSYVQADLFDDESLETTEQEFQGQQARDVPETEENQEVPDMIDIFGDNDELIKQIDAVEQRDDLTLWQKIQLVIAYLKACTVQEVKEHITEHLQANSKRYLVAASVSTLFVATVLLCDSLESSINSNSKNSNTKNTEKTEN